MSSNSEDDDDGEGPTDCCGMTGCEDVMTCPDCSHTCCESCEVSSSRGLCFCKYSLRGDANSDQTSEESRNFLRSTFGYRGKFKPILQVRMEKDMVDGGGYQPAKARAHECGYQLCNAPPDGWSKENPPNRTKLTDETLGQFVMCEKCRSVAYCSEECRDADAVTPFWDRWSGEGEIAHGGMCEPYMKNDKLPYVSLALREYKREFGRYPNPLGR